MRRGTILVFVMGISLHSRCVVSININGFLRR